MAYLNGLSDVVVNTPLHPSVNGVIDPNLAGGELGFVIPVSFSRADESCPGCPPQILSEPFSKKLPGGYNISVAFNNLGVNIYNASNKNICSVTSDGTFVMPGISELVSSGAASSSGWLLKNTYFQLGNNNLPQPCGVQQSARNFWEYGLKAVNDPFKIYYSDLFGYYTPASNVVNLNACKSASFIEAAMPIIKFAALAAGAYYATPIIGEAITSGASAAGMLPNSAASVGSSAITASEAVTAPYVTAAAPVGIPLEPVAAMTVEQGLSTATIVKTATEATQLVSAGLKVATQVEALKMLEQAPLSSPSNFSALPDTGPNAGFPAKGENKKPLTNVLPYALLAGTALLIFMTRPK